MIEVQIGSYLGEDDIIRADDVYHRAPDETSCRHRERPASSVRLLSCQQLSRILESPPSSQARTPPPWKQYSDDATRRSSAASINAAHAGDAAFAKPSRSHTLPVSAGRTRDAELVVLIAPDTSCSDACVRRVSAHDLARITRTVMNSNSLHRGISYCHRLSPSALSMPTSSTPLPRHSILRPMQANARSTNSRTECISPVAST